MNLKPYCEEEKCILQMGWNDGLSDIHIQELLRCAGYDRSLNGIKAARSRYGLIKIRAARPTPEPVSLAPDTDKRLSADTAFKRAMLNAIASGEEKAILGVVKDRRPWVLRTIRPDPAISLCSSSAGWSEYADNSDPFA